jgi:ribose 5-phosphate isomerase B
MSLGELISSRGGMAASSGPSACKPASNDKVLRMKIAIASDHAGFPLKEEVRAYIAKLGHEVEDLGAYNTEPSDYSDFAVLVGKALISGKAERGVLICGSGVGVCVAANKMPGVRAGMCHDSYSAHQGVEHDEMNVLVMGARIIGTALAFECVKSYLDAKFIATEERFVRRLNKVKAIEKQYMPAAAATAVTS